MNYKLNILNILLIFNRRKLGGMSNIDFSIVHVCRINLYISRTSGTPTFKRLSIQPFKAFERKQNKRSNIIINLDKDTIWLMETDVGFIKLHNCQP